MIQVKAMKMGILAVSASFVLSAGAFGAEFFSEFALPTFAMTDTPIIACGDSTWLSAPAVDGNGIFTGTIGSECTVKNSQRQGMKNYIQYAMASATGGDGVSVISKYSNETYQKLPSQVARVSSYFPDNQVTIVADVHIASDQSSVMIYDSQSQKIQAPGGSIASAMQSLVVYYKVTALDAQGANYKVSFRTTVSTKRPWWAPAGIFRDQTMSHTMDTFTPKRDLVMQGVSDNI